MNHYINPLPTTITHYYPLSTTTNPLSTSIDPLLTTINPLYYPTIYSDLDAAGLVLRWPGPEPSAHPGPAGAVRGVRRHATRGAAVVDP